MPVLFEAETVWEEESVLDWFQPLVFVEEDPMFCPMELDQFWPWEEPAATDALEPTVFVDETPCVLLTPCVSPDETELF